MATHRFLLDQNFPNPVFPIHEVDARISYEHFSNVAPQLARVSTPDWMVYLFAHHAGFDAVVTRDYSQLSQREEIAALTYTTISVVTWRKPINDPIAEWGQLLAYGPQISRALTARGPCIVFLPEPRLELRSIQLTTESARQWAAENGTSYPEMRAAAVRVMRAELERRNRSELLELLRD